MDKKTRIALVGRPNVGKSTLFNRLLGKKRAIVYDQDGVTRDCRQESVEWLGLSFELMDTPGLFDSSTPDHLQQIMRQQSLKAINDVDIILWVLDGKSGCTADEEDLANILRQYNKKVFALINKAESVGEKHMDTQARAWQWGVDDVIFVSAEHGLGMSDLFDVLAPYCESVAESDDEEKPLKLLILGRPNVGKSTLTNLIIGEERQLVADQPGVTRDALAFSCAWLDRPLEVVDTAGIRRALKKADAVEKMAIEDARHRLQFSEVVIMVLDATTPPTIEQQDLRLMHEVMHEGRPFVLALNKWDQVKDKKLYLEEIEYQFETNFGGMTGVQYVPLCAKTGEGLVSLMKSVFDLEKKWNRRASTHKLNDWLNHTLSYKQPPAISGRPIKLKYITQKKGRPPTFVIFGNQTEHVPQHYTRFLVRQLQKDFGFDGVPVRFIFQNSKNPYKGK